MLFIRNSPQGVTRIQNRPGGMFIERYSSFTLHTLCDSAVGEVLVSTVK